MHTLKVRVRDKRLCFLCLQPGHYARHCTEPRRCEKCNRWHNTLLHRELAHDRGFTGGTLPPRTGSSRYERANDELSDQVQEPVQVVRPETKSIGRKVLLNTHMGAMPVVPVNVVLENGQVVTTSAVIDSGSAITLCTGSFITRNKINITVPNKGFVAVTIGGEIPVRGKGIVHGLSVKMREGDDLGLPPVYVVDELPIDGGDVMDLGEVEKYDYLRGIDLYGGDDIEILIGNNATALTEPIDVINAPHAGQPYAVLSRLGWYVQGIGPKIPERIAVGRIKVKDEVLDRMVRAAFDVGFDGIGECREGMSGEDERWLKLVREGCRKVNSHYEIPLPIRTEVNSVPDSRRYVWKRTENCLARIKKDPVTLGRYDECMHELLRKGYAEPVPITERGATSGVWYLPHFSVTHPDKQDKLRVVFDCAASVQKWSLNDLLITGPRLGNELLDVISRFREGPFALVGDIEAMFYQVRVPEIHRNYLRFYWWGGNSAMNLEEYRMTVHPFGACSSPSVAAYALMQVASDNNEISELGKDVLTKNFYVDDCLVAGEKDKVLQVVGEVQRQCKASGFNLCKFKYKIDGDKEDDAASRVLGMIWDRDEDTLRVDVKGYVMPNSRRKLLSIIASVYDPIGMLSPAVLRGRQLLQQSMSESRADWDDCLSNDIEIAVRKWLQVLCSGRSLEIPRNVIGIKCESLGYELHIFSDASVTGHGVCAHVRRICDEGAECYFILGKARVNPMKAVSVPRLELVAATLSTAVGVRIVQMLSVEFNRVVYWTDSTTVLAYIRNIRDRFNMFVANRVSIIKARSVVSDWRYVDSELNPADDASRAVITKRWLNGPEFLYLSEHFWPQEHIPDCIPDLEIKRVMKLAVKSSWMQKFVVAYSSWLKLCRGVAWLIRLKDVLKGKERWYRGRTLHVMEINLARRVVLQAVQREYYEEEIDILKRGGSLPKSSALRKLNLYLDDDLLRVGGRLGNADLNIDGKHPIIVSR